jgi:hypothetical protein
MNPIIRHKCASPFPLIIETNWCRSSSSSFEYYAYQLRFPIILDSLWGENSNEECRRPKLMYRSTTLQYSLTFVCIISWTSSRWKVPRKRESQDVHVQNNNYLMQSSLALSGFAAFETSSWRQREEIFIKRRKRFIHKQFFIERCRCLWHFVLIHKVKSNFHSISLAFDFYFAKLPIKLIYTPRRSRKEKRPEIFVIKRRRIPIKVSSSHRAFFCPIDGRGYNADE